MIRVFVVDDHPMVRRGIAAMLEPERDVLCVGEAGDGADALRNAPASQPDVLLLDLSLPGSELDAISTMVALRALVPQLRFVAMASATEMPQVQQALAAGAAGYLLKDASTAVLVATLRAVYAGQRTLPDGAGRSPQASPEATETAVGADLTQRERELLALMAHGLSNQEIALRMGIAMPTVKFHVTNVLSKLHAENRTEAVLVALRNKLVTLQ